MHDRMVVVRKNISVERGDQRLFDEHAVGHKQWSDRNDCGGHEVGPRYTPSVSPQRGKQR
jgi:hypothetical protein